MNWLALLQQVGILAFVDIFSYNKQYIGGGVGGWKYPPLHIYKATMKNSKIRKCFRYQVYKLAESSFAQIRVGDFGDGIFYSVENNLVIQLAFESRNDGMNFQSQLRHVPSSRKRTITDSTDIHIEDDIMFFQPTMDVKLKRVFDSDYDKIKDDKDPSDDCNGYSFVYSSANTTYDVDEVIKLRLLDSVDSVLLVGNKTEICHFKSQTTYPDDKKNDNNIVFATRHIHEHFDGLNKLNSVPSFVLKYLNHDATPVTIYVNGKQLVVYETRVRVEFFDEKLKDVIAPFLKDGYKIVSIAEIEFSLHFPNPDQFKKFAAHKEKETRLKWNSLNGLSV